MTTERISATRTVAAPPAAVFAVLTDPDRHQDLEPGDWVRSAIDLEPLTGVGQVFGMNMGFPHNGQAYVMHNLVTAFVPDRTIAWVPGQKDDDGVMGYGGWVWRYDLAPDGDGTAVTLTYDWYDTPQAIRDELGVEFPPLPDGFLDTSLASLEAALRPAGAAV